jgi:hypothetical protein
MSKRIQWVVVVVLITLVLALYAVVCIGSMFVQFK